ncbi:peptide maturation system acyl carrier-related protein [Ruminiclostridium herbifermentans]|uniref:peptide maturation system acyl carrier-related protein n=1 Tax=Ruminiclostridium herbifermentans TaxID=2488810 RepID=UPI001FD62F43|nr:peptide maturation system acyl carrier-related protein [Ruminiclostridium herbifermentans]
MLTCKRNIEKELENIFINRFGLDFTKMEAKNDYLLGSNIKLAPRDLLYIFVDVEKEFNIKISESFIIEGKFNTFNNILNYIKNERESCQNLNSIKE